jgi:hypothetical protein
MVKLDRAELQFVTPTPGPAASAADLDPVAAKGCVPKSRVPAFDDS